MARFLRLAAPLVGSALFLSLAATASAHAHLVSSTPGSNSTVATAPGVVTITFDDDLDKAAAKITVAGPNGATVSGQTTVSASNTKVASVSITNAGNGKYTVNWHAVADDDKGVTEGSFAFNVGAATAQGPVTAMPKTGGGGAADQGGPSLTLLLALGAVVLCGCAAFARRRKARA
jgi:methionine-rich copper-binding protein CopC